MRRVLCLYSFFYIIVVSVFAQDKIGEMDFDRFWLPTEIEFREQNDCFKIRSSPSDTLKLGQLLSQVYNLNQAKLKSVTSYCNGKSERFMSNEVIADYDIFQPIRVRNSSVLDKMSDYLLVVECDNNNGGISRLLLHVSNAHGLVTSVNYRSICITFPDIDLCVPSSSPVKSTCVNFLVTYDFMDRNQIAFKADSIMNSAKKHLQNGTMSELEKDVLRVKNMDLSYQYGYAKWLLDNQRYLDASLQLLDMQYYIAQNVSLDSLWTNDDFGYVNDLLFSCYERTHQEQRLIMFNKIIGPASNKKIASLNRVTLFESILDPTIVLSLKKKVEDIEKKGISESVADEYSFYCRRLGYAMVETKKLDEAERYYEKALKVNSQDERAKDELLYIYKLKNGELQFNAQKLIKPDPYNACNIGYLVREFFCYAPSHIDKVNVLYDGKVIKLDSELLNLGEIPIIRSEIPVDKSYIVEVKFKKLYGENWNIDKSNSYLGSSIYFFVEPNANGCCAATIFHPASSFELSKKSIISNDAHRIGLVDNRIVDNIKSKSHFLTKDELYIFEELPKEWKNAIFRGTFALSIEAYSEAIAQFRWVRDQMNVDYFINGVPEKRLPSYLYLSSKIAELYKYQKNTEKGAAYVLFYDASLLEKKKK